MEQKDHESTNGAVAATEEAVDESLYNSAVLDRLEEEMKDLAHVAASNTGSNHHHEDHSFSWQDDNHSENDTDSCDDPESGEIELYALMDSLVAELEVEIGEIQKMEASTTKIQHNDHVENDEHQQSTQKHLNTTIATDVADGEPWVPSEYTAKPGDQDYVPLADYSMEQEHPVVLDSGTSVIEHQKANTTHSRFEVEEKKEETRLVAASSPTNQAQLSSTKEQKQARVTSLLGKIRDLTLQENTTTTTSNSISHPKTGSDDLRYQEIPNLETLDHSATFETISPPLPQDPGYVPIADFSPQPSTTNTNNRNSTNNEQQRRNKQRDMMVRKLLQANEKQSTKPKQRQQRQHYNSKSKRRTNKKEHRGTKVREVEPEVTVPTDDAAEEWVAKIADTTVWRTICSHVFR